MILGWVWLRRDVSRKKIAVGDAVFIGLHNAAIVLESRSGITITAGLYLGLNLASAVRFSFLLAIPAILGAVILGVNLLIQGFTDVLSSSCFFCVFIGIVWISYHSGVFWSA